MDSVYFLGLTGVEWTVCTAVGTFLCWAAWASTTVYAVDRHGPGGYIDGGRQ